MSTLSLWEDPAWQGRPVHKVTDTLVGARLDDHSEDQEVYGVESVLRQMELHVEATMTIIARRWWLHTFRREGMMLRVQRRWCLEPLARVKLLRSMRLWLVWCLHILSLTWKSLFCAMVNLKIKKWDMCSEFTGSANLAPVPPICLSQMEGSNSPVIEAHLTDQATSLSMLPVSLAQFFRLLRLLLLTFLSAAIYKNIGMKKGVSRSNVFLFCFTKFCNDFFIVYTLTKWCRIAALTVKKN